MTPALNKSLPEFEAIATGGIKFTPQGFIGQTVVLYDEADDAVLAAATITGTG